METYETKTLISSTNFLLVYTYIYIYMLQQTKELIFFFLFLFNFFISLSLLRNRVLIYDELKMTRIFVCMHEWMDVCMVRSALVFNATIL